MVSVPHAAIGGTPRQCCVHHRQRRARDDRTQEILMASHRPHARHQPPDHSKGDESTIGGYMAVHDRPAAFEGSDGFSYSVEIMADESGMGSQRWGAFFLFVKWARL